MIDDEGWVQDDYYDSRRSPNEDEEQEQEWRREFDAGEKEDV